MIDYGLSGKVALITGVSRNIGIGAAISHYLAVSGANINYQLSTIDYQLSTFNYRIPSFTNFQNNFLMLGTSNWIERS